MPRPAMSGAEPCVACAIATSPSPMHRPGAMPRPPTRPAASSDRMSPNMLVVTTTSKLCGSRTSRIAKVSTITSSTRTSGYSAASFLHSSTNMPQLELEHRVLVDVGEVLAALARQLERGARDAAAAGARDHAHRQRHLVGRAELARAGDHVAVGLEALVVLAHDHQVDVVVQAADVGIRARRPHVGEQVELLAQDRVRVDRVRPPSDRRGGRSGRGSSRRASSAPSIVSGGSVWPWRRRAPARRSASGCQSIETPCSSAAARAISTAAGTISCADVVAVEDADAQRRGRQARSPATRSLTAGTARSARARRRARPASRQCARDARAPRAAPSTGATSASNLASSCASVSGFAQRADRVLDEHVDRGGRRCSTARHARGGLVDRRRRPSPAPCGAARPRADR